MSLHHLGCVRSFDHKIQRNMGSCLSPHVRIDVGIFGKDGRKTKALPRYACRSWHSWQGYVEAYSDKALALLD
jgi:hypothetical protein